MRVLITGASGQLGQELQQQPPAWAEVVAVDVAELDISDDSAVFRQFERTSPELVINAAAYTAVDKAEEEAALAHAVNAQGAANLAAACRVSGARLIHISTDFVFDGHKSSPYTVNDEPQPLGVYGQTKLEGERYVLETLPQNTLVVRVGWLYSRFGQNFAKTMLRLMDERDELRVVADQVGTPTHAEGLAAAIWQFASKPDVSGIYHWSDAGVASWYDFSVAIMEEAVAAGLLPAPITIWPITTADYPTPASRPAYSVLDKQSTWQKLETVPLHWRHALRDMLTKLPN